MVIVNAAGAVFTVGNSAATDSFTANATRVIFDLVSIPGEQWDLTVDGIKLTAPVGVPATVAAAFATRINNTAALAGFTAFVEGDVLVVVKRAGGGFTTSAALAVASAAPAAVAGAATQAFTLDLAGTPREGDTWTVRIGANSAFVTVQATGTPALTDTLAQIAQGLASAIRARAELADYTALARGASLVIINMKSGTGAAPTLAIGPSLSLTTAASAPGAYMLDLSRRFEPNFTYVSERCCVLVDRGLDVGAGDSGALHEREIEHAAAIDPV